MVLEPNYSLGQAIEKFFPDGPISVNTLRKAIREGELQATKPQGKLLVTKLWLSDWLNRCRVTKNLPASGSGLLNPGEERARHARLSGVSLTVRNDRALDAANATLSRLSANLRTTSRESLNRRRAKGHSS
jgi:hypothetical protein